MSVGQYIFGLLMFITVVAVVSLARQQYKANVEALAKAKRDLDDALWLNGLHLDEQDKE